MNIKRYFSSKISVVTKRIPFVSVVLLFVFLFACHSNKKIKRFEKNLYVHVTDKNGRPKQTGQKSTLKKRMTDVQAAGLSITVIDNYKIGWTKFYGYRQNGTNDLIEENTVFQSASTCKFVTALIVMHYVEKGLLNLDVDVNYYLESWKMPTNEFNKTKPVTLRHLLSHQSGLSGTNFGRQKDSSLPSLPQILDAKEPAINKPAYPVYTLGEKWQYSNIAYVVIQLLLEEQLGKPFTKIAEEVVFEPLGMDNSTFQYPLDERMQDNVALPHSSDGKPGEIVQDSKARAQSGMFTTTTDMATLLIEVMNSYRGESARIIGRVTLNEMFTRQIALPIEAFGVPLDNGLGIFLEGGDNYLSILHPGHSYPGSYFFILAFPETGQGLVLGQNDNSGDLLDLEIISILSEIYGWSGGQYF